MKNFGYMLALGCLLAGVNGAFAGLTPVGDPTEGNSWLQEFNVSGDTGENFDQLVVQWVSGTQFEATTFTGMAPGWTSSGGTTAAWATGTPAIQSMNFILNWVGDRSAVMFNFWALEGGVELGGFKASYPGSGGNDAWVFSELDEVGASAPQAPVPEPLTMASAFFAMGGLGAYIRRRKKARA